MAQESSTCHNRAHPLLSVIPTPHYPSYFMTHFALLLSDLVFRCASVPKRPTSFLSGHSTLLLSSITLTHNFNPRANACLKPFFPWSILIGFLSALFTSCPHYLASVHRALWSWVKSTI